MKFCFLFYRLNCNNNIILHEINNIFLTDYKKNVYIFIINLLPRLTTSFKNETIKLYDKKEIRLRVLF